MGLPNGKNTTTLFNALYHDEMKDGNSQDTVIRSSHMSLSLFEERVRTTGSTLGISLDILRPAVSKLLGAISTSTFFRTYTDHSIDHCAHMFSILTWLIPPSVQASLTDVEHALLTVAVYLHDLGMLATQEEFANRNSNEAFRRFEQNYLQTFDPSSRKDSDHPSPEHFIFEEYVRHTHPQRIYEWITGGPLSNSVQGAELSALLHSTDKTFRHYLGVICRSHHLSDLYDKTTYPLEFRFGNRPQDQANIQFLAICLRLADILHMSNDRTPPVEFRIISPRNPVSAREWAKQLQVSGVCPSRIDPSEILVNAVCVDHRMFFYLRDFVGVADSELQRCRAWLDSVPAAIADKYYLKVRCVTNDGIHADGFIADRFELHLDQRRVIELLMGHNLYGDSKVAIRELVQNSIDAIRVRKLEEPTHTPLLRLTLNTKAQTLTILDNGIGMTLDVIRRHFLRVGDSYYRSAEFRRRCPGYTAISQFGIGFLTAFMIADNVEVLTCAARESSQAVQIVLEDIYDLFAAKEIPSDDSLAGPVANGGTQITLRLRKDTSFEDLADQVSRWLVFLEFPVEVIVDDASPQLVCGVKGQKAEDIAADIAQTCAEPYEQYCPIMFENEGVHMIVLWQAERLGDNYLLAPVGHYLLPLTASVFWRSSDDRERGRMRRREEPRVLRKIANGGIYLSDEMPGFKVKEHSRLHYIIDCRGDCRFTPLVSRAGVAIDQSSVRILAMLVKGVVDYLVGNAHSLIKTGVSKYFCAYYAARAMSLLFDRNRMENQEEKVLSAMLAANEAQRVPMLLIREGSDIALKTWKEHAEKPVVIGKNMYDTLLRSITRGTVNFPIPKEVVESLPENYIVPADIDDILWPLMRISEYIPARVTYEPKAKGVFVTCEKKSTASIRDYSGIPTLTFPDELSDVSLISFELAQCWNTANRAVQTWFALSDEIVAKVGEEKRSDVEETIRNILSHREGEFDVELMKDEEVAHWIERMSRKLTEESGVAVVVSKEAFLTLRSTRMISDRLWRWDSL